MPKVPTIVVPIIFRNEPYIGWLPNEAAKAGRVDPNMKKNAAKSIANYKAKAPQKSEIFSSGRAGANHQYWMLDSTQCYSTKSLMKIIQTNITKSIAVLSLGAVLFSCNKRLR